MRANTPPIEAVLARQRADAGEMGVPFASRDVAAEELGYNLKHFRHRDDVTVLGLPRGGIPLAARVAETLGVPVDTLPVQKITLDEGQVFGAIAHGGLEVKVQKHLVGFTPDGSTLARARELAEQQLVRKMAHYVPLPSSINNRCAILVDDGIASGLTMLTAARAARRQGAASVIVAAPIASPDAAALLRDECDELVCLAMPKPFNSLAECYLDFAPMTDEACARLLQSVNRNYRQKG